MALTLITTETISSAVGEVDFISGITSAYSAIEFHCYNIHPVEYGEHFGFQVNCSSGNTSGFDNIITSNFHDAWQSESGSSPNAVYQPSYDQAEGTGLQYLAISLGGGDPDTPDADAIAAGILTLYDPTNVDTMTHFISRFPNHYREGYLMDHHCAGYINAEEPIDEVRFQMTSGDIETCIIKMFGVS